MIVAASFGMALLLISASGVATNPVGASSGCGITATSAGNATVSGDTVNLGLTTGSLKAVCGVEAEGRTVETIPSTIISSANPCTLSTAAGDITTTIACAAQAILDAERCDPALGGTVSPTTSQTLQADGTYSAPDLNTVLVCNQAPGAAPVVVTQADFRTLHLTPSAIVVGPTQGWLPVNMIAVVYTDAAPQVITTTLLGQPVTVRATPTTFLWDWADGSPPTTTTDPGAPWPDHTVSYTYPRTGDYIVTMTTTWTGEYSLDGGTTYTPITGTASTISTAPPLTVKELRSHLVEDLVS